MLLMVEKVIRWGICDTVHQYVKLIINMWKIMIKIKNPNILNIGT